MTKTKTKTPSRLSGRRDLLAALSAFNAVPDRRATLIGLAVIAAAAGLLVFNSLYGLNTPDEAFYPVIPYRMLHGARLFIDDWHVTQTCAFIHYPFVRLFLAITGAADGILLFFRFLFIAVQLAFSAAVFLVMRRYGFFCALASALLFELYVTEYTLALDYYTISIFSVLAIVFLLFFSGRMTAVKWLAAGVFFALAVLAEPVFVVVFVLWGLAVLVAALLKKQPHPALALRSFCLLSAGIAVVAAAFFAFLFSKETPAAFFANIFNVFRSGEYAPQKLGVGYLGYAESLYRDFSWTLVPAGGCLAALLIDKNRQKRKLGWTFACLAAAALLLLMTAIKAIERGNLLSFISPPFAAAYLGLCAYILCENRQKELFVLWLSGPMYILVIALTSEAMIYAGSSGFSLSCVAVVPLFFNLCRELSQAQAEKSGARMAGRQQVRREAKLVRLAAASGLALGLSVLCIYSGMLLSRDPVAAVFKRDPLRTTVAADRGAYKGIRISPEQKKVYDAVLDDIAQIERRTDGRYTVLSDNLWYAYSSDRDPLAFTVWYEECFLFSGAYEDYYAFVGESPACFYIIDKALYWGRAGREMNVDAVLQYVKEHYDCTVTRGAAGYIIEVNNGHAS